MPRGNKHEARDLADGFRQEHGLGLSPLPDVFELVFTTTKVDIFSIDAGENEHGLLMVSPEAGRRVVVIATTRHPMRQRSSVAHELGHLLRGDADDAEIPAVPGERTPAEICADAFARHLLLPGEALHQRWSQNAEPSLPVLSALVRDFGVSPAIAAIQLHRERLIPAATFEEWKRISTPALASRFGWRSHYSNLAAASLRPRAPQMLMQRAVIGYQRGVLGLEELAQWYGLAPEILQSELGEPVAPEGIDQTGAPDDDWGLDVPLFPESGEGRPG